jgi:hypothetical protein
MTVLLLPSDVNRGDGVLPIALSTLCNSSLPLRSKLGGVTEIDGVLATRRRITVLIVSKSLTDEVLEASGVVVPCFALLVMEHDRVGVFGDAIVVAKEGNMTFGTTNLCLLLSILEGPCVE